MTDSKRILIAGCGKIGLPLAQRLSVHHQVWGLSRSRREGLDRMQFVQADLLQAASLTGLPAPIDTLVYCVSPQQRDEAGYRAIYVEGLRNLWSALISRHLPTRLIYVSSSSVYGQNAHEWVDEDSPTEPAGFSGQIILEAEQLAHSLTPRATVVRFSGIYGGTRSRLIELVQSGQAQLKPTLHYSNRIHEADCIGFLQHLLAMDFAGQPLAPCYLASDSLPVDQNEVLSFLAEHLGVTLDTGDTPLLREGVSSKRCRNSRMLNTGYRLLYPTFREGYQAMLAEQTRKTYFTP